MSLSTLSGVKTAALDELDRTDLSSYADDFITMAEGHFNRNLRHRKSPSPQQKFRPPRPLTDK